jgi:hypothetical protein
MQCSKQHGDPFPLLEEHGVCKYDDRLHMLVRQQLKCRVEIIRLSHLGGNQLDAQPFASDLECFSIYDDVAGNVYD